MFWKALVILSGWWLAGSSESEPPSAAAAAQTEEDLAALAADLKALEHSEFRVREAAARRLVARQRTVVVPLMALAQADRPEASVRAFELLRRLHREGDEETYEEVESAFESLAQSENVIVVARAETAIEGGAEVRHRRAVGSFQKLGGIIRYDTPPAAQGEATVDDATSPPIKIKYAMIGKTWTGGDEGLKYLRRMEDFRTPASFQRSPLYLIKGSKVTPEGLAALQATLPDLIIQPRGPACLGVQSSTFGGGDGCEIGGIERGSAADKAGLQIGDILTKFGGADITDFNSLIEQIGQKQPGDKVPVQYQREGREEKTVVELGDWK